MAKIVTNILQFGTFCPQHRCNQFFYKLTQPKAVDAYNFKFKHLLLLKNSTVLFQLGRIFSSNTLEKDQTIFLTNDRNTSIHSVNIQWSRCSNISLKLEFSPGPNFRFIATFIFITKLAKIHRFSKMVIFKIWLIWADFERIFND